MDGGRPLFSAWDWVGEGHIREQGRSLTGQEAYTCDMVHVLHMEPTWGNARTPFGPRKPQREETSTALNCKLS